MHRIDRQGRLRRVVGTWVACVGLMLTLSACGAGDSAYIGDGAPQPGAPGPGVGEGAHGGPDLDLPQMDASRLSDALSTASLETVFDPEVITQFEPTHLTATIVFGAPIEADATTVQIAYSNKATLSSDDPDAFEVTPTSGSRRLTSEAVPHPGGGYALSWSWDVTPLVAGDQTLNLSIQPSVVIDGEEVEEYADINEPIPLTVEVHPVQREVDEVADAAGKVPLELPDEMTVGEEQVLTVDIPLEGHADTVGADVELAARSGSVRASIEPVAADAPGSAEHAWKVTALEPGPLALVLTTSVHGEAGDREIRRDVRVNAASTVNPPPPTFWEMLQGPVLYITPFVALAATIVGLWQSRRRRKPQPADSPGADEPDA